MAAGARFIWYRNHSDEPDVVEKHIVSLRKLVITSQATMVFGARHGQLLESGDPVHQPSWLPWSTDEDRVGSQKIRGRSCHSLEEVLAAETDGCTYATLSPIWTPTSHKTLDRPPLGIDELQAVCGASTLPVYALGGVQIDRVRACLQAGAHGVAVLGPICLSKHPARVVNDLLEAVEECDFQR